MSGRKVITYIKDPLPFPLLREKKRKFSGLRDLHRKISQKHEKIKLKKNVAGDEMTAFSCYNTETYLSCGHNPILTSTINI